MNGCFNCKKRYLCTESDCFDGFYEDNHYLGSDCNKYEYEEDDDMVEPIEPNEALNDSLRALDRTLDEINKKMDDEEYCMNCECRDSCSEWNSKIVGDCSYYTWLDKISHCRENKS